MRRKISNKIISIFLLGAVFASNLAPTAGYADSVVSSSEEVATSSSDEYVTESTEVESGAFTMSFKVDGVNIGNLKKNPKYNDKNYYIPAQDDVLADNEQASEYRYVAGFNALLLKDADGNYTYLPSDEYYVDSVTVPRQESIFSTAKSNCSIYVADDPRTSESNYAFLQTGTSRQKIKAGIDRGYHAVAAVAAFDTDDAERQYYAVETINFNLSDETISALKQGGSIVCSSIRQRFAVDNQDEIVQTKDQMSTDTPSVTEMVAYLQQDKIEADGTFPCIQTNEVNLTFKEKEAEGKPADPDQDKENSSDTESENVVTSSSEPEQESELKEDSAETETRDDKDEKQEKANSSLILQPNLKTAENTDDFAAKLAELPQNNRIIIKTKDNADDKIADIMENAQTVGYDNTYITSCDTPEEKQEAIKKLSEDDTVDLVIDDSVMQICDLEMDGETVRSESDTAETNETESVSASSEKPALTNSDSSNHGEDQTKSEIKQDKEETAHTDPSESENTKKSAIIEKTDEEKIKEEKAEAENTKSDQTIEYAEIKEMAAGRPVIALIDTGSSDADYAVNFTEDSEKDVNGHGSRMAKLIRENAGKNVFILSLKAMNDDGTGTFSNVLAAIRYAKEHHADYINLSISVRDSDETDVLKEELNAAAAEGITIIAAAGNYGSDAKDYFPGNLAYVQTTGYLNDDGSIGELSNYGKSVNWYVKSKSTSEAAAILTGVKAGGKNPSEDSRFSAEAKGTTTQNPDNDTSKFKTQATRGSFAQKIYNRLGSSSHCLDSGATSFGATAYTFCVHHGFFVGYQGGDMGWNDTLSKYQLKRVAERLGTSFSYADPDYDKAATDSDINSVIWSIGISPDTATVSYSNGYRDTVYSLCGITDSVTIRSGTGSKTDRDYHYAYFYDQDPETNTYSYYQNDYDYTRNYYDFICWTDGWDNYYPGNSYSDTSSISLSPKYDSDASSSYLESYIVFPKNMSKTGYTFQGWYTSRNGRGTRYSGGSTTTIDSSCYYYAYYTANPYTVKLDKNGGSGGNDDLYYTYNTNTIYNNENHTTAISQIEIPKRTGYEFAGYYIGSTQIVDANGNINGSYFYRTASNQTAYAKWKFDVQFNSNAPSTINPQKIDGWEMKDTGANAMSKQTFTASENNTLSSVKYSAFGYTFAGWSLMPGDNQAISYTNNGQIRSNPTPDAGKTITLYAQWKKNAATVTYNNLSGASNSNPSTYAPADGEWTLKDLKRSDAAFLGWTGSNGSTPQKNVLVTKEMLTSTPNLTFTANWKAIKPYLFVDSSTMFTPILKGTADNGGKFRLIESKPADGYILDKTPIDLDITKGGAKYNLKDHILSLDVTNQPNQYTIKKVDDAKKTPLAGAKFEVWYGSDTANKREYISDDKGEIVLYGLKPGVWHYRETKAPKGYYIIYDAEYDIVVNNDGTIRGATENTIANTNYQPLKSIILKKQDENGASIADVELSVTYPDGYTENLTTKNTGLATLTNEHVQEGTYTVQEIKTKEGYVLDRSKHSFHAVLASSGKLQIQETGNGVYPITNKANKLTIHKTDKDSGKSIPEVAFDIWHGTEKTEDTMHKVTDENGEIVLSALESGTWYYQETSAPSGYQFDTEVHTFTVADDGTISSSEAGFTKSADQSEATLSITNQKNHFEIHKVDQDKKPLSGVSFLITSDNGYRETKTTNANGQITLEGLPIGVYTYAEQPNDGYVMDGKAYTFTVRNSGITPDSSTLPAIVNTENEFVLQKTDEKGNALSGAAFRFSYDGKGTSPFAKDSYLTDNSGQITFKKLPAGKYTFEETKTKDNTYQRDQKTHSFTVSTTGELTTTDTTLKAEGLNTAVLKMVCPNIQYSRFRVTVTKRDSDNNKLLNEAAFDLYDKDNKKIASLTRVGEGVYRTDYIQLTDAMMENDTAAFTVRETTVPQGYAGIYEHTFSIEPSKNTGDLDYAFEAGNQPNQVVIKKISEQGTPLSGVIFKIWKQGEKAAEYTTDNNGLITLSKLSTGTWHYQETKTLDGYVLDSAGRTFTVTETGIDGSAEKTFTVVNKLRNPKTVELVVKKQSTNGVNLTGAEFDVQQWDSSEGANGAYVPAGNMRYDEQTGTYKNDVVLTVTNTNKGKFKIIETKAPEGYLGGWSKEVTVADDEKTAETVNLTAVNESNQFTIYKRNENGDPLANTVFRLEAEDPSKFAVPFETKTLTTNTEGKAVIQALVPGSYLLTEISSAPGYVVDMEQKRLVVNQDSTMCVYGLGVIGYDVNGDPIPDKETNVAGKLTYTVTNKQNTFRIHKKAGNGANAASLSGAVFSVWKEETGSTRTSYTTDSNGEIRLTGLTEGTWKFQETKAPQGYRLPSTVYTFYVTDKGTMYMDGQSADTASGTLEKDVANFQNYPTGQIKVRKVDKDDPEKSLENAAFDVLEYRTSSKTYQKIGTLVWNPNTGYYETSVTMSDQNGGLFRVVETKAPSGYTADWSADIDLSKKLNWIFDDTSTETEHEASAGNTKNELKIHKIDSETGTGVEGITFDLCSEDDTDIRTGTTDDSGYVSFRKLMSGTKYRLRENPELTENDHYQLDTAWKLVTVDANGRISMDSHPAANSYTETITNDRKDNLAQVRLHKVDAYAADSVIDSASFEVYQYSNVLGKYESTPYGTLTYDVNTSEYVSPYLKYTEFNEGKFKVVEIGRPSPSYVSSWSKEYQFKPDNSGEVHMFGNAMDEEGNTYETITNLPIRMQTQASDDVTGSNIMVPSTDASVTDLVSVDNLEAGKTYRMVGRLMNGFSDNRYSPEKFSINGRTFENTVTFTVPANPSKGQAFTNVRGSSHYESTITNVKKDAETPQGTISGTIKMHFAFDSSNAAGSQMVFFEYLYDSDGNLVASHADLADEKQSVLITIPDIHTTLTDQATGDHNGQITKEDTLVDSVAYKYLSNKLKYRLTGTLVHGETKENSWKQGDAVKDKAGKEITATVDFTPEQSSGTQNVVFRNFDASGYAGCSVVAYEKLYLVQGGKEILLAEHNSPTDLSQTVYYQGVHTSAETENRYRASDDQQTGPESGKDTIWDTVEITGLMTGVTSKDDDVTIGSDGTYLYTRKITAGTADYQIHGKLMSRTADGKQIYVDGKPITITVNVHVDGKQIAASTAANPSGSGITVTGEDGKTSYPVSNVVVHAKDIETSRKTNAKTGETISRTTQAAPVAVDFTVKLPLGEFDAKNLEGQHTVVFEQLYHQQALVAEHSNLYDMGQSIRFPMFTELFTGGNGIYRRIMTGVIACAGFVVSIFIYKRKRKHQKNR